MEEEEEEVLLDGVVKIVSKKMMRMKKQYLSHHLFSVRIGGKVGKWDVPGLYPNWTGEHTPFTQYPNTPNVAPLKLPRAIVFVIGTDMQDNKRRTNAASRNTVAGVAARPRMLTLHTESASTRYNAE
jgi:hypothetical protein